LIGCNAGTGGPIFNLLGGRKRKMNKKDRGRMRKRRRGGKEKGNGSLLIMT